MWQEDSGRSALCGLMTAAKSKLFPARKVRTKFLSRRSEPTSRMLNGSGGDPNRWVPKSAGDEISRSLQSPILIQPAEWQMGVPSASRGIVQPTHRVRLVRLCG
jgi:hypothetical protein